MIVEKREIKPSKIKPIYSASPDKRTKHYKPELKLKPRKTDKNEDYARSWQHDRD